MAITKIKKRFHWIGLLPKHRIPVGIYMFKVSNRNTRTRCETCSKLTIRTPERPQWRRSGVFIVNFEHILHLVLFLLLTLNMYLPAGITSDTNADCPNFWNILLGIATSLNLIGFAHTRNHSDFKANRSSHPEVFCENGVLKRTPVSDSLLS